MSKTGVQLWQEGGIGGLVGGIFMRGNKSIFLRQSTLYSLSHLYHYSFANTHKNISFIGLLVLSFDSSLQSP